MPAAESGGPARLLGVGRERAQHDGRVEPLQVAGERDGRCRPPEGDLVRAEQTAEVVDHVLIAALLVELAAKAREDGWWRVLRLEDGGASLEHDIAQGQPLVVREQREQPRQGVRRSDAAERIDRGLRQHVVGDRVEQWLDGARIADLSQRRHRRELQPEVRVEEPDQAGDRLPRFERAERLDRRLRDVRIAVLEQGEQRLRRARILDPREDLDGEHRHFGILSPGERHQVRHRVRALPFQRGERRVAEHGVLVVSHEATERLRRQMPRSQRDRFLPRHRLRLLERRDDLGVARAGLERLLHLCRAQAHLGYDCVV